MINWLKGLFPHECLYVNAWLIGHEDLTWHECKFCGKHRDDDSYLDIPGTNTKLQLSTAKVVLK